MKASIDHLPEAKQKQLAAMAEAIRAEAPAAGMIVLFGSHARGDWVEDAETGYRSDYDLLVVVETAEAVEDHARWARVEAAARAIAEPSPVTVIVHDFRELNQQIRRGQFFFAEVWEQGVALYDGKRFTLATPKGEGRRRSGRRWSRSISTSGSRAPSSFFATNVVRAHQGPAQHLRVRASPGNGALPHDRAPGVRRAQATHSRHRDAEGSWRQWSTRC